LQRDRADVRRRKSKGHRRPVAQDVEAGRYCWELIGVRDAELGLRFEDSRRGQPDVVVVLERRADQTLEHLILKYL